MGNRVYISISLLITFVTSPIVFSVGVAGAYSSYPIQISLSQNQPQIYGGLYDKINQLYGSESTVKYVFTQKSDPKYCGGEAWYDTFQSVATVTLKSIIKIKLKGEDKEAVGKKIGKITGAVFEAMQIMYKNRTGVYDKNQETTTIVRNIVPAINITLSALTFESKGNKFVDYSVMLGKMVAVDGNRAYIKTIDAEGNIVNKYFDFSEGRSSDSEFLSSIFSFITTLLQESIKQGNIAGDDEFERIEFYQNATDILTSIFIDAMELAGAGKTPVGITIQASLKILPIIGFAAVKCNKEKDDANYIDKNDADNNNIEADLSINTFLNAKYARNYLLEAVYNVPVNKRNLRAGSGIDFKNQISRCIETINEWNSSSVAKRKMQSIGSTGEFRDTFLSNTCSVVLGHQDVTKYTESQLEAIAKNMIDIYIKRIFGTAGTDNLDDYRSAFLMLGMSGSEEKYLAERIGRDTENMPSYGTETKKCDKNNKRGTLKFRLCFKQVDAKNAEFGKTVNSKLIDKYLANVKRLSRSNNEILSSVNLMNEELKKGKVRHMKKVSEYDRILQSVDTFSKILVTKMNTPTIPEKTTLEKKIIEKVAEKRSEDSVGVAESKYPFCTSKDITLSNGQVWASCDLSLCYRWGDNQPRNCEIIIDPGYKKADDSSWGGIDGNSVSRKGPCSDGYHIPSVKEWSSALNTFNATHQNYQSLFDALQLTSFYFASTSGKPGESEWSSPTLVPGAVLVGKIRCMKN